MSVPVQTPGGLPGSVSEWWREVRSGDLGSLPIVMGLVVVAIIFQAQNSNYLSAGNFVNLIVQAAAITTIAMGVVFVLLVGEIDLSVGFVSGVSGVLTAVLLIPDGSQVPVVVALLVAVAAGAGIGLIHGLMVTKLGMPSFVVTLAGLLAWNGVVLLLLGSRGSVIIQDTTVVALANGFLAEEASWLLLVLGVAAYGGVLIAKRRTRQRAGLQVKPIGMLALRVAALTTAGALGVTVANRSRGIPYVLVVLLVLFVLLTYVLNQTRFGLWIYAIGGSLEAARRAGINTDRVRIACFMICSMLAAVGGIVLASRLRSVDTNAGGGALLLYSIAAAVIGGTSLFGGRGSMRAAVLGALVIAAIDNGLGLLGLGSGQKFVITGLVLLAAVAVDSLSRRSRADAGRA